jgi:hypothetical protein
MNDDQDPLQDKAVALQKSLEQRHGPEVTQSLIDAVGAMQIDPNVLRRVVAGPDALDAFEQLGTESLLRCMERGSPKDSATRRLAEAHGHIRERQRQNWRNEHGRR